MRWRRVITRIHHHIVPVTQAAIRTTTTVIITVPRNNRVARDQAIVRVIQVVIHITIMAITTARLEIREVVLAILATVPVTQAAIRTTTTVTITVLRSAQADQTLAIVLAIQVVTRTITMATTTAHLK